MGMGFSFQGEGGGILVRKKKMFSYPTFPRPSTVGEVSVSVRQTQRIYCAWLLFRGEEGHRRAMDVVVISNINKALPRPITTKLEQSTGGKNCTVSSLSRRMRYECASLVVFRLPCTVTIASQASFRPKMFFRHHTHTHTHTRAEQSRCRRKLPHVTSRSGAQNTPGYRDDNSIDP